VKTLLSAAKL